MTTSLLDQLPPCSPEAEAAVLSSLLLSPAAFDDVASVLAPADFYLEENRRLFEAMSDVHESGRPVDMTLVREALKDSGNYDRIGGGEFLARILQSSATASHVTFHASIVREKSRQRQIIDAATVAIQRAHSGDDASTLAATLASDMDGIAARSGRELADAKKIAELVIDNYERRKAGEFDTVSTGIGALDALLGGGFCRTDYVVIGARTSFGKTALGLSFVAHLARDITRQALLFSIEMTRDEIGDRLTAAIGKLPTLRLRSGKLPPADESRLVDTAGRVSQLSFKLDDSPSQTVASVARTARREARRKPLSCIVVDYLQLLEAVKRADRRDMELAQMSRKLKGLAQELRCPVIVLAQLNKDADGARPRMSHLREADSISHEANVVLLLDRPHFNDERPEHEGEPCKIILDKNRNGPRCVSVPLLWFAKYTRFVEAAPAAVEPPQRVKAFEYFNRGAAE